MLQRYQINRRLAALEAAVAGGDQWDLYKIPPTQTGPWIVTQRSFVARLGPVVYINVSASRAPSAGIPDNEKICALPDRFAGVSDRPSAACLIFPTNTYAGHPVQLQIRSIGFGAPDQGDLWMVQPEDADEIPADASGYQLDINTSIIVGPVEWPDTFAEWIAEGWPSG